MRESGRWPKLVVALVALVVVVVSGCAGDPRHQGYQGDGKFVDHGKRAAAMRYVVDLGDLDLGTVGDREFTMSGLPGEEFTIGLEIHASAEPAEPMYEAHPLNPTLRLQVTDERELKILSETAPLGDWTWSGTVGEKSWSFVYLRGDIARMAGVSEEGRTSSFTARPEGRYRVRFTVIEPDPNAAGYTVTLRAFGGGWKANSAERGS